MIQKYLTIVRKEDLAFYNRIVELADRFQQAILVLAGVLEPIQRMAHFVSTTREKPIRSPFELKRI